MPTWSVALVLWAIYDGGVIARGTRRRGNVSNWCRAGLQARRLSPAGRSVARLTDADGLYLFAPAACDGGRVFFE